MVDLAYLSPEMKSTIIREDADYQFVYVNPRPIHIGRVDQNLVDKINGIYNSSVMHARILEMHTPTMELIKETNIDNVSIERITPILNNLIKYDYSMFIDLMAILATMLENKDAQMNSDYIDFVVECSNQIVALDAARTNEVANAEDEPDNGNNTEVEETIAEYEAEEIVEETVATSVE